MNVLANKITLKNLWCKRMQFEKELLCSIFSYWDFITVSQFETLCHSYPCTTQPSVVATVETYPYQICYTSHFRAATYYYS